MKGLISVKGGIGLIVLLAATGLIWNAVSNGEDERPFVPLRAEGSAAESAREFLRADSTLADTAKVVKKTSAPADTTTGEVVVIAVEVDTPTVVLPAADGSLAPTITFGDWEGPFEDFTKVEKGPAGDRIEVQVSGTESSLSFNYTTRVNGADASGPSMVLQKTASGFRIDVRSLNGVDYPEGTERHKTLPDDFEFGKVYRVPVTLQ